MILWKEVKNWAKKQGYESCKNEDSYSWYKASNPSICGEAKSVSGLAKAIFNDFTCGKWIKHQEEHQKN
jgi:hypothetical protein